MAKPHEESRRWFVAIAPGLTLALCLALGAGSLAQAPAPKALGIEKASENAPVQTPAVTPQTPAVTPQAPAATPQAPAVTPQAPAVTPQAPVPPIPPAQVAVRSEDLARLLQQMMRRLRTDPELDRIQASITVRQSEIDERSTAAAQLLQGTPTLFELRDLENYWREMTRGSAAAKRLLGQKAASLQRDLDQLSSQEAVWTATLSQIASQPGLLSLSVRIQTNLESIGATKALAQDRLSKVLALQGSVGTLELQVADIMDTVSQAMAKFQQELRVPEVKPLWAPRSERVLEEGPARLAHPALVQDLHNLTLFARSHTLALLVILALALATLVGAVAARNRGGEPQGPPGISNIPWLTRRPMALAMLVAATGLICFTAKAPAAFISLTGLLCLLPYFRIFVPLSPVPFRQALRAFAASYLTYELITLLPVSPVLEREINALWAASALAACLWFGSFTRAARMRATPFGLWVVRGIRLVAFFMLWALAANFYGCFDLSTVLAQGTLYSLYLAVVLFMVVQLASEGVDFVLRSPQAQFSQTVQVRRETIHVWTRRALSAAALLLWLGAASAAFTLSARLHHPVQTFLKTPIVVGKAHVAPVDVLYFFLTLACGFMLAQVMAFILREEILSRMNLRRGLPQAFSTVTRYFLYCAVFLFAFFAAGIPMDKFTLLTGAFGVGIGFGLQNVVNNFVSGLILLFERPINAGDTVEVGGLTGQVARIGIRSCTIKTYQGAEVIVPNSSLVSSNVVNWTLSDARRRVEIPVGVAYGTDPARVIALMEATVRDVPGILPEPAPVALFLGFGDSALLFEVRFWCPDQDLHLVFKSHAAVALNEALTAAGIEIPFPQRDVHIKKEGDAGIKG